MIIFKFWPPWANSHNKFNSIASNGSRATRLCLPVSIRFDSVTTNSSSSESPGSARGHTLCTPPGMGLISCLFCLAWLLNKLIYFHLTPPPVNVCSGPSMLPGLRRPVTENGSWYFFLFQVEFKSLYYGFDQGRLKFDMYDFCWISPFSDEC